MEYATPTDTYIVGKCQTSDGKPTYSRFLGNSTVRFGVLALVAALIAFVVLSAGTTESTRQDDADPRVFTGKFVATGIGVLTGTKSPNEMLELYAPKCKGGESGKLLRAMIAESRQAVPNDKRIKIEGVEFGEGFGVESTSNGYAVQLPNEDNIQVLVNGKWGSAREQFASLGFDEDSSTEIGRLQLEFADGKLRVASC